MSSPGRRDLKPGRRRPEPEVWLGLRGRGRPWRQAVVAAAAPGRELRVEPARHGSGEPKPGCRPLPAIGSPARVLAQGRGRSPVPMQAPRCSHAEALLELPVRPAPAALRRPLARLPKDPRRWSKPAAGRSFSLRPGLASPPAVRSWSMRQQPASRSPVALLLAAAPSQAARLRSAALLLAAAPSQAARLRSAAPSQAARLRSAAGSQAAQSWLSRRAAQLPATPKPAGRSWRQAERSRRRRGSLPDVAQLAPASTRTVSALREGPAAGNRRRRKLRAATPASCARSEALAARYRSASASRRRAVPWAARSAAPTSSVQRSGSALDRRRSPPGQEPSGPRRGRASAWAPQTSARFRLRPRQLRPRAGWPEPTTALPSAWEGPLSARTRGSPGGLRFPAVSGPRSPLRPPPAEGARVLSADRRQASPEAAPAPSGPAVAGLFPVDPLGGQSIAAAATPQRVGNATRIRS
jgi:hypothetical protein